MWFVEALSFCQEMKNIYFLFFFHSSGNLTNRIVWTLLTEVVIFVVTIVLAMVDSSEWSGIFFYLTIGSVIILNSRFFYSYGIIFGTIIIIFKKVIIIRRIFFYFFFNLIVTFLINFQWPLVFTKIQCSVWLPNCLSNILELYFLAL